MLALNRTAGKTTGGHLPPVPPLHSHRQFSSTPLYFRNPPRVLPLLSLTRTRAASSSPPPLFGTSKPNQPSPFFDVARNPFLSPIKTGFVTAITAAVIFISGFCFTVKPALAWAGSPPATVERAETEAAPSDVDVLQVDFRAKNGDIEVARLVFYLQMDIDLFRVTTAVHADSEELKETSKKVERALKLFNKNKSDCRGLKLMSAVIKALQRNYDQAMKMYAELEKEDPIDCSLYFFKGMTYIALEKKEEADESFVKFRKFVTKTHPFAKFYYPSMLATKIVAPKPWDERAATRKG